jgi:hypothetical protein
MSNWLRGSLALVYRIYQGDHDRGLGGRHDGGDDYSSQRISFLRDVLRVLEVNVADKARSLDAIPSSSPAPDDLLALGDRHAELRDKIEGLGHKLVIVGLSSLVESIFGMMLKQNAPALYPGGRADWSVLRDAIDKMRGRSMDRLAGWPHTKLVRLLSNCFKHEDGFASPSSHSGKELKAWVDASVTTSIDFDWGKHVHENDGKIDYGALPVAKYIEQVEIFLNELESLPVVRTS